MNKKRILSILLAVCMVFGMVLSRQTDVSAKSTESISVVFNGKKAIILNSDSEPKTLSQVEKKWGKKTRMATIDESSEASVNETYVWEKGDTTIIVQVVEGAGLGSVKISINDKKSSVAGVKVGMKKKTALKKLRSIYGKKNVEIDKKYNEILVMPGSYAPIAFPLKNSKVSSIRWWRS